ncbi:hypothetical protein [Paraburkholderia sp. J12]|uniref:hypothetical protein n=1 Tax=Paraburkholderia sp. J12 TaxID=2805432 RepID=UPI002ABE19F8|nr:hypothetical protein [Paraburkholderia sp. J12]
MTKPREPEKVDFFGPDSRSYKTTSKTQKRLKRLNRVEWGVSLVAATSVAFLAIVAFFFLVTLLVLICLYVVTISVAFLCYAQAMKLLGEKSYRDKLMDFRIRMLEMKQEHERVMASVRLTKKEATNNGTSESGEAISDDGGR